jgi:hypothetical protein
LLNFERHSQLLGFFKANDNRRMTRPLKPGHGRKFPTRISQEDLKSETMKHLTSKGANFHFQASFYTYTSEEVVGSKDPKFATLQPTIKSNIENEAWAQAWEFIYDFLQSKRMVITLKSMKVEFGKRGEPPLGGLFEQEDRDQFFSDLLALEKEPFIRAVERYQRSV